MEGCRKKIKASLGYIMGEKKKEDRKEGKERRKGGRKEKKSRKKKEEKREIIKNEKATSILPCTSSFCSVLVSFCIFPAHSLMVTGWRHESYCVHRCRNGV